MVVLNENITTSAPIELGLGLGLSLAIGNAYREWQYLGQSNNESLSINAQYDRFSTFIEKWERALGSSTECHLLGDLNINFLEYNKSHIPVNSQSYKLRKLINLLFARIIPLGAVQCVNVATRISPNQEDSGLDHYFCTDPSKLSEVQTIINGASDHKILFATRFSKSVQRNARLIRKRMYRDFDKVEFIERVKNIRTDFDQMRSN